MIKTYISLNTKVFAGMSEGNCWSFRRSGGATAYLTKCATAKIVCLRQGKISELVINLDLFTAKNISH